MALARWHPHWPLRSALARRRRRDGEVYLARNTQLERDVAVKVVPLSLRDAARVTRFRRETEVLAALNHGSVAPIHGFVDAADAHAIVMEFVRARRLHNA